MKTKSGKKETKISNKIYKGISFQRILTKSVYTRKGKYNQVIDCSRLSEVFIYNNKKYKSIYAVWNAINNNNKKK